MIEWRITPMEEMHKNRRRMERLTMILRKQPTET